MLGSADTDLKVASYLLIYFPNWEAMLLSGLYSDIHLSQQEDILHSNAAASSQELPWCPFPLDSKCVTSVDTEPCIERVTVGMVGLLLQSAHKTAQNSLSLYSFRTRLVAEKHEE